VRRRLVQGVQTRNGVDAFAVPDLDARACDSLARLELEGKVQMGNGVFSTTALSSGCKRLALLISLLEDRPIAALIEDGTSSRRSVRHTRPFMAMFAGSGRTREGSCYSSEARRSGGPSTGGSSTGRTLRRAGSRSGQASDRQSPAVGFDAPHIHSLRRACREPRRYDTPDAAEVAMGQVPVGV
jgi:hypothetical protein